MAGRFHGDRFESVKLVFCDVGVGTISTPSKCLNNVRKIDIYIRMYIYISLYTYVCIYIYICIFMLSKRNDVDTQRFLTLLK